MAGGRHSVLPGGTSRSLVSLVCVPLTVATLDTCLLVTPAHTLAASAQPRTPSSAQAGQARGEAPLVEAKSPPVRGARRPRGLLPGRETCPAVISGRGSSVHLTPLLSLPKDFL